MRHGSSTRRGPGLITAILVAVAVIVISGVILAVKLGSGDPGPTTAASAAVASPSTPPSTPSASSQPTRTVVPPAGIPKVAARSGYRSVIFSVDSVPERFALQVHPGPGIQGSWRMVPKRSTFPTKQGGERSCAGFRFVRRGADLPEGAGKMVRVCGRSKPPSIELIRTDLKCGEPLDFYPDCRYYNIRAAGFAPGSRPVVRLYSSGTKEFCPTCKARSMVMDKQGRGVHDGAKAISLGEIQIVPSENPSVIVQIAGVRRTFQLP